MHFTSTPSRLLICLFVLPWAMAAVLDANLGSAQSDVMQENTVFQTNDECDETTDTCKTQDSPAGAECKIECVRSFCFTFILRFLDRVEERLIVRNVEWNSQSWRILFQCRWKHEMLLWTLLGDDERVMTMSMRVVSEFMKELVGQRFDFCLTCLS